MEPRVNIGALYAAMNAKRIEKTLSWRQVATELGVSPSTLTRMSQGKHPDVDAFMAMVAWVGLPAERFLLKQPVLEEGDPMIEVIALIHGNPRLGAHEARVLENVLSATYQSLKGGRS